MTDFLARVCRDVGDARADGAYARRPDPPIQRTPSLVQAIGQGRALVAELKLDAPSWETRAEVDDVLERARGYVEGGAAALSCLTERDHFGGSPELLGRVAGLGHPTLMKDFVVHPDQVACADAHGASTVLLVQMVFDRSLAEVSRDALIGEAHDRGLEVLLEASTADGFERALGSDADVVAVNARRLDTLDVSLDRAVGVLEAADVDRPAMILSAMTDLKDAERAWRAGADAVLVGTALMRSEDPAEVIRSWLAS